MSSNEENLSYKCNIFEEKGSIDNANLFCGSIGQLPGYEPPQQYYPLLQDYRQPPSQNEFKVQENFSTTLPLMDYREQYGLSIS